MASQVPYNPDPTVAPQLAPTPYGRNQPPPGAFGGLTAAALEHMGSAINQAGNELFERANAMQLMSQSAAADEAASAYQMDRAKGHADMLSLQGKAASDGLNPYLQSIEDSRQQFRESLTSPYAQMQYDRDTRRTQGVLMDSAARHAAEQEKSYYHNSLQSKSDVANITALSLPQDDATFKASLADKDTIGDQMLAAQAFPGGQDQRDKWVMDQKSKLSLNRITGLAKTGDPFVADRMLSQSIANKEIFGSDIAEATRTIYYQQNTQGAKQITNQLLSGGGSAAGSAPLPMSIASTTMGQYLSKDNYDLVGHAHDGSGQALGRYGVPAEKLSAWLKESDMDDMTAGDFLKSHAAQDQLFTRRFGKLQDDSGSFNDAVNKWLGRPTTPVGPGTSEQKQAFSLGKSMGWSDDFTHAMVATLSGESGSHLSTMANQKAGGRNWEDRFEVSDPSNGIANWDQSRSKALESWASGQGLNPNKLETQMRFVDYEVRQMGFDPTETGDPRALTLKLTGSTDSGQGYEKPAINNGAQRWAQYSGQRYAQDPVIQQTNGLIARNTPLSDHLEQAKIMASDLAPNNPLFGVYLSDRLTSEYRKQEYQQKTSEDKLRYTIESAIVTPDKDGRVPTTVDELPSEIRQAFDNASEKDKLKYQSALANNLVTGGFKFNPESFQEYAKLKSAAIDPGASQQDRQALLDANISDMHIPLKARFELFKLQQQVYKQEETSPQMGQALRVLGPTLSAIDLTKKRDPDNYNSFVTQLHDAIQEYNRESAKPLSDDDITQIGARLLRDSPTGNKTWYYGTETKPWYQHEIPTETMDKIKSDPRWSQMGIDPTDEMIHSAYVRQKFQQFYAKQQAQK